MGGMIRREVRTAAGPDKVVDAADRARLGPLTQAASEALGEGPQTIDAVVDRAMSEAMQVWAKFNPTDGSQDARWLAKDEIRSIERDHPAVGRFTQRAADVVRARKSKPLTAEQATEKARAALPAYLKNERMKDGDWLDYFPATWPEAVAMGILDHIAGFGNPAHEATEIYEQPDRFIIAGRGPFDLYTEVSVAKAGGKILNTYVEID